MNSVNYSVIVNVIVKKQSDSVVPKLNTIATNVDKIRDEIEKNLVILKKFIIFRKRMPIT